MNLYHMEMRNTLGKWVRFTPEPVPYGTVYCESLMWSGPQLIKLDKLQIDESIACEDIRATRVK